jgi:hypothetical protein
MILSQSVNYLSNTEIINKKYIIIIIGKETISFMQGIYTYIPETNYVPKQHNVAAILSLLFMEPISLAPVLALMYSISALSEVCVQCPIWQFSVFP